MRPVSRTRTGRSGQNCRSGRLRSSSGRRIADQGQPSRALRPDHQMLRPSSQRPATSKPCAPTMHAGTVPCGMPDLSLSSAQELLAQNWPVKSPAHIQNRTVTLVASGPELFPGFPARLGMSLHTKLEAKAGSRLMAIFALLPCRTSLQPETPPQVMPRPSSRFRAGSRGRRGHAGPSRPANGSKSSNPMRLGATRAPPHPCAV